MSPNVLSLERCRLLAEVYPKAKTELYHVLVKNKTWDIVDFKTMYHWKVLYEEVYPAWQIHELLKLFKNIRIEQIKKMYYVWVEDDSDKLKHVEIDVSLVEALGKLCLWEKEVKA